MVAIKEFIVIDLCSQRDAVEKYVHGWSADEVVSWLGQYGSIWKGNYYYHFCSFAGMVGWFYFDDDGNFRVSRSGWLY